MSPIIGFPLKIKGLIHSAFFLLLWLLPFHCMKPSFTHTINKKNLWDTYVNKFILKFDCRISGLSESWLSSPNLRYFQFFMDSDSDIHLASVKTSTYLELPPYFRMPCFIRCLDWHSSFVSNTFQWQKKCYFQVLRVLFLIDSLY